MRKEYGNKMMMISLSYQFVLAWVGAFIVNIVGSAIVGNSNSSMIELLIGGAIICLAIIILAKMMKKESNGCSSCSSCSSCPSNSSCCSDEKTESNETKKDAVKKSV